MIHITNKAYGGANGHKLYVITMPVAVSEVHYPADVEDTQDARHNQWWSEGTNEEPEMKVLEIRVWAKSKVHATSKLARSLHKASVGD